VAEAEVANAVSVVIATTVVDATVTVVVVVDAIVTTVAHVNRVNHVAMHQKKCHLKTNSKTNFARNSVTLVPTTAATVIVAVDNTL
jgi:hypothetical protein